MISGNLIFRYNVKPAEELIEKLKQESNDATNVRA